MCLANVDRAADERDELDEGDDKTCGTRELVFLAANLFAAAGNCYNVTTSLRLELGTCTCVPILPPVVFLAFGKHESKQTSVRILDEK
jgi:hypothetical protein